MTKQHPFDSALVDQTLTGGLWIGDSSFKSAIYLRNGLKTDKLTVTPVLYLGDGTRYALAPVTLAPEATEIVDVNQALIAHNLNPSPAISGYVELQYQWHWAALCAFIRNVDVAHSVIFTSPLSAPPSLPATALKVAAPATHTIEGMWWKQEKNVSAFVALSNVTGNSIHATLSVDSQGAPLAGHTVLLRPHTTATVDIADLPLAAGSSGGVHVSYDGPEGGLAVNGGLEDLQSGYSVNLPFVPIAAPAAGATPVNASVAQLSLMSGSQTSEMHLPADTVFSPYSIAHNLSNAPLTITPEIWWMADSVPKSAMLASITVAAHGTQSLEPAALLKAARLYSFQGGFNLVLHTSGLPNALLLAGGSVDATNNYVFSVAPHSVSESAAKSLSYWSTANGDDTMVTLWNPADEEQAFVFRLTYPGGHYLLPVDLGAGATQNLNIAEVIRNQKPDAEGNIIPAGTHFGAAEIHGPQGEQERILVAMDAGIYNADKATCFYGCNSCSGYTGASILLAAAPLFPAGATSDQLTFMVQYDSGYQYDRTSQSAWSSDNTGVATVSNGYANAVSGGTANFRVVSNVSDPVAVTICNGYFPGCPIAYTNPTGRQSANVPIPMYFLSTSAVSTDGGCAPGSYGSFLDISYYVADATGARLSSSGITPLESVYTSVGGSPIGGSPFYLSFATPVSTRPDGSFDDVPFGTCFTAPPATEICINHYQSFEASQSGTTTTISSSAVGRDCSQGIRWTSSGNPPGLNKTYTQGVVQ